MARLRATNAAASMSTAAAVDDSGIYTAEHMEMRRSLRKLIDAEINPYVDEWEAEGIFPAHDVFKKLGDGGFLGVTKPVEFGGLGLDFSYSMAIAEEMGNVHCGGVPMAVGVQTDVSRSPAPRQSYPPQSVLTCAAMAHADTDGHACSGAIRVRRAPPKLPRTEHRRRLRGVLGRQRGRRGLRCGEHEDDGAPRGRRIRHQRVEDVDH